jgi:hypothetical protein
VRSNNSSTDRATFALEFHNNIDYRMINYTCNTKDYMVPSTWGQVSFPHCSYSSLLFFLFHSLHHRLRCCWRKRVFILVSVLHNASPWSQNRFPPRVSNPLSELSLTFIVWNLQVDKREDPYAPQQNGPGCCVIC